MVYQFPYTNVVNPFLAKPARIKSHPLLCVGLSVSPSSIVTMKAYIDTGAQHCYFNADVAKRIGIKDYRNAEVKLPLSGIGGKKTENIAYFHNVDLIVFKDWKKPKMKDKQYWKANIEIAFLERQIGFAGVLGVYGFLDRFTFKTNIPKGWFEIEPIFD